MVIHIYTGNGKGKTTAALGVALRAVGHNKDVVMIQFMKGRKEIGEYKVMKKLGKHYKIYQFGGRDFVDLKEPSAKDIRRAREAFSFAKQQINKAEILILDEIDVAVKFKLVPKEDVIEFMKKVPKSKWVIFTGRYALKELQNYADYVTEFRDIKRPKEKMRARKGIEY